MKSIKNSVPIYLDEIKVVYGCQGDDMLVLSRCFKCGKHHDNLYMHSDCWEDSSIYLQDALDDDLPNWEAGDMILKTGEETFIHEKHKE